MMKARALTHHHHTFLKQAYALNDVVDLYNSNTFKHGQPYIKFDPYHELFGVWVKHDGGDRLHAAYRLMIEAVHKANSI